MQFKYPELLWALFLLLIPIFIHLFQLRRFKKTPFTNVKLLQKVVAESRRSSTLKKWLLLITRLLLFAALILAFAQPFLASKTALTKKETVIYLDNSFSMQAKQDEGTLLETAVQDLIETIPRENTFSLFTNEDTYTRVTLKEIQNELLTLQYTQRQLQLDEIWLKAQTLFSDDKNTIKHSVVISDFQSRMASALNDSVGNWQKHLVKMQPGALSNIMIDTAYISPTAPNTLELTAILSGSGELESIPVSLYNGDKLIAKTAAVFEDDQSAVVVFTLPANEVIDGKIEISDAALSYDNQLFFNLNLKEKIKVLSIGDADSKFLARIYADAEFSFSSTSLNSLNYSILEKQNFIILNELPAIPNALQNALRSFVSNGGSLTVIPNASADLGNYNAFLSNYGGTGLLDLIRADRNITTISFTHPLYQNVFEKRVTNFQFPMVSQFYRIRTRASAILSYQDNTPFLVGSDNVFLFTAPLDSANSNFKNSPLIVPTFYSMASNSLKLPQLYHLLGQTTSIDVPVTISNDNILKVSLENYEFIPQQQYFTNKTSIIFNENPAEDGIYTIGDGKNFRQNISFNHPRAESDLTYLKIDDFDVASKNNTISGLFGQIEKGNRVTELWKWFVILALLFMLAEVFIQKIFK